MRLPVTFGAILALALVTGCGGGGGAPTTAPSAPTGITCGASGSGAAVSIVSFAFNPASSSVAANGFVTWTNTAGITHTVTFDNGPDCGSVSSGGGTVTAQFTAPGSYSYHCNIHPSMKGTIVVN